MTDTLVRYHTEGFGRQARPAVNVKCYGFDHEAFDRLAASIGESRAEALFDLAYQDVAERFWGEAEAEAASLGLGPIESEGRSGGWLVLTDGRDPEDGSLSCVNHRYDVSETCAACVAKRRAWLTRYRKLSEWCAAYIAEAPGEVAHVAADIATREAVTP